jgi:hypothetical protein
MVYRSLIFLGILSLTAAASADPAGSASGAPAGEAPAADTPAIDNRNCLRETGSMIHRKDGCTVKGANADSYDQDDIRRTGATTASGALGNLMPGAAVGR